MLPLAGPLPLIVPIHKGEALHGGSCQQGQCGADTEAGGTGTPSTLKPTQHLSLRPPGLLPGGGTTAPRDRIPGETRDQTRACRKVSRSQDFGPKSSRNWRGLPLGGSVSPDVIRKPQAWEGLAGAQATPAAGLAPQPAKEQHFRPLDELCLAAPICQQARGQRKVAGTGSLQSRSSSFLRFPGTSPTRFSPGGAHPMVPG